ncbi:hypothetical protein QQF64_010528 [Cirrhinus molitorella]|uniref:Uncharacterized protein n=1 Tax=Cirrhinus molitorella TaxID=172907 RepID=A0ABR3M6M5_9TELE
MLSEEDWIGCKRVIGRLEVRGGVRATCGGDISMQRSGAPVVSIPHRPPHVLLSVIMYHLSSRRRQISSVICEWISIPRTKSVQESMSSGRLPELISQMKRLLFCSVMNLCGRGKERHSSPIRT